MVSDTAPIRVAREFFRRQAAAPNVRQGFKTRSLPTKATALAESPTKSAAELRKELIAAIGRYPEITDIAAACYSVPMISTPPCERYRDCLGQGKLMPPVLIDEDGCLLDGRHRVLAASRLGVPLEFEVTPRSAWAIAYESLVARKHAKFQVAGFAANMIGFAKNGRSFMYSRKTCIDRWLAEIFGAQWTVGLTSRSPLYFMGKFCEVVAGAFGISETSVKQARSLTLESRISVIDGRPLYIVYREQQAQKRALSMESSAYDDCDDDSDEGGEDVDCLFVLSDVQSGRSAR